MVFEDITQIYVRSASAI